MPGKAKPEGPPQHRARHALGAGVYWFLVAATWLLVALIALTIVYGYDLPTTGGLADGAVAPLVTLLGADGREIAVLGSRSNAVPISELPAVLIQAVTAVEDRRFFTHRGVDIIGIARAAIVNLFAGRIKQGGSTITQQLAKTLFLQPDRTLKRKFQELLLALWLEERLNKDAILGLYLNRVYFGAGSWGVEAAARRYFGTSARDIGLAEAAMLAGLLKAPSRYAPSANPSGAAERAAVVLNAMVEAGFITLAQAAEARAGAVRVAPLASSRGSRYFADWVLDRVPDYVGDVGRDLVVVTTLDVGTQRAGEQAVAVALDGEGQTREAGQAALVAMAPDGAVRAMVGGRSYHDSPFNRATAAHRQPGSAFKLFVYIAGLEAGLTPEHVFHDEPVDVAGWRPRNYAGAYSGAVTMRDAFALSINTVAVQVAERAGRKRVIEVAARLGLTTPVANHPSLALGAMELRLLEITGAYAAVANGGQAVLPYAITEIRDGSGTSLYRRGGSGPGRALSPATVAAITDMLRATITSGTGRVAALDRPVAGKTGTSQDFRDAWFIGFSADLVAGLWFGNDDGRPMHGVTGGGLPARAWRDFMAATHHGRPLRALPVPDLASDAADVDVRDRQGR